MDRNMRFKWPLKLALHGYLNQAPYLSVLCGEECLLKQFSPQEKQRKKPHSDHFNFLHGLICSDCVLPHTHSRQMHFELNRTP